LEDSTPKPLACLRPCPCTCFAKKRSLPSFCLPEIQTSARISSTGSISSWILLAGDKTDTEKLKECSSSQMRGSFQCYCNCGRIAFAHTNTRQHLQNQRTKIYLPRSRPHKFYKCPAQISWNRLLSQHKFWCFDTC
jgi:hypothetical protein